MKKYISPDIQVIAMETESVIADSLGYNTDTSKKTKIQLESQQRTGIDWDKYYNYGE